MNDQHAVNKPALSLEEELDVLEAVYRIGQKKGLDLLRPEQVKKLQDAGRKSYWGSEMSDPAEIAEENREARFPVNHFLTKGIMRDLGVKESFPHNVDGRGLFVAEEALFKQKFGCFPDLFSFELFGRDGGQA